MKRFKNDSSTLLPVRFHGGASDRNSSCLFPVALPSPPPFPCFVRLGKENCSTPFLGIFIPSPLGAVPLVPSCVRCVPDSMVFILRAALLSSNRCCVFLSKYNTTLRLALAGVACAPPPHLTSHSIFLFVRPAPPPHPWAAASCLVSFCLIPSKIQFHECWWDSVIIDLLGANILGMTLGYYTLRFLETRTFNWNSREGSEKLPKSLVSEPCI